MKPSNITVNICLISLRMNPRALRQIFGKNFLCNNKRTMEIRHYLEEFVKTQGGEMVIG